MPAHIEIQIPEGENHEIWLGVILTAIEDTKDWRKGYDDTDQQIMKVINRDLAILKQMSPTLEEG